MPLKNASYFRGPPAPIPTGGIPENYDFSLRYELDRDTQLEDDITIAFRDKEKGNVYFGVVLEQVKDKIELRDWVTSLRE